ncbi:MAG: glycoside hydrolase family 9 protein [Terracidiphilus sp.]|jgi:endoglucanase
MASSLFLSPLGSRSVRELLLLAALAALFVAPPVRGFGAETPTTAIKVDQVGYPLNGPKVALVSAMGKSFELKRSSDGVVVFRGNLTAPQPDVDTGDQMQAAEFSGFSKPGTYYLDVAGVGRSWNFTLGSNVYERPYYMAMRGFYGQRCGTAVDMGPEFPGFSHPACHLHGEFHPSSGKAGERNNVGGWHDAGDYGRYEVNSSISTGTLLWAWEIYGPRLKNIQLKIPETGNRTPDILNEARWNLEWMLKMQDEDGGVWHKQTSAHFSGFIAPQDDTLPSVVIGTGAAPYKSTCATADLAAVAAIAARVYKPFDAKFAEQALRAARRAFEWAENNPNVTFRNPPGVSTGEYGDRNCGDERLWAAAELARTTGETTFNDYLIQNYAQFLHTLDSPPAESWSQVAPMALWSYALSHQKNADSKAVEAIRQRTLAAAKAVVERTRANAYHTSMKTSDYGWGSNGTAAGYGMYLLIANVFSPAASFTDAACDNLHYLLGRNTFSLSWVTQVGENPFQHPHHRPSGATGKAWPGLLSGGPDAGRQDAVLKNLPRDLPPAKVYADQTGSYASNEICINWQAALVFLLAGELN